MKKKKTRRGEEEEERRASSEVLEEKTITKIETETGNINWRGNQERER